MAADAADAAKKSAPATKKLTVAEAREAAAGGDAVAMVGLGMALLKDGGDAKSYAEAADWLERASKETTGAVRGNALYALAYCVDAGRGRAADPAAARAYVDASAACGNAQALLLVAAQKRARRHALFYDLALLMCLMMMFFAVASLLDLVNVLHKKGVYDDEISGADNRTVPAFSWSRGAYDARARSFLLSKGAALLDRTSPPTSDGDEANPLSDGFSGTRGVMMHFTRRGLDAPYGFAHPAYAWLKDEFLDGLLDDRCDAFVFNILAVPPGRAPNKTRGVDTHVDQTLMQTTTIATQTAFMVSVGYMQVPDFIDGGELVVNGYVHYPTAGDVLTFRGDLPHYVRAFCADGAKTCETDEDPAAARVSFVLEQYRVPKFKADRTPAFVVAPSSKEQSYLPVISSLTFGGGTLVDWYLALRSRRLAPRHAGEA